jgi:hypothetical protein
MNGERLIDWAAEPRLPHHFPLWIWRRARYRAAASGGSTDQPVSLILSFDVEQDLGSNGTPDRWDACEPFLHWLGETSARHGWRTTLFVQGSVVEPLAGLLRSFVADHELGLHGY